MLNDKATTAYIVGGLAIEHWTNSGAVREIFAKAFDLAGMRYYNPHRFRDTLAKYGAKVCRTLEEHKAWSQNLGHSSIVTTDTFYGTLSPDRQREILNSLGRGNHESNDLLAREIARLVQKHQVAGQI